MVLPTRRAVAEALLAEQQPSFRPMLAEATTTQPRRKDWAKTLEAICREVESNIRWVHYVAMSLNLLQVAQQAAWATLGIRQGQPFVGCRGVTRRCPSPLAHLRAIKFDREQLCQISRVQPRRAKNVARDSIDRHQGSAARCHVAHRPPTCRADSYGSPQPLQLTIRQSIATRFLHNNRRTRETATPIAEATLHRPRLP
jgi:hypothetical protein